MPASKHVRQVVLSAELDETLDDATVRLQALFPDRAISRSSVARECIRAGLPTILQEIRSIELARAKAAKAAKTKSPVKDFLSQKPRRR